MTNVNEQNKHQLYKDAHARFLRAEEQQNIKAAAKYPEPLNPASWTAEELADHAAQEVVDMLRYIEALRVKAEDAYKWGQEQRNNAKAAKQAWWDEVLGDTDATVAGLRAKCEGLEQTLNETNSILFRFQKALQLISEIDIWAGESAFAQATAEEALRGAGKK